MKHAQLLIVDDHPIVRQGLVELINRHNGIRVTEEAGDADEAMSFVRSRTFDLVIVDLSLRGRSGLELIKQIGDEFPVLPILVLSMQDELFYAERALRMGARGYVMKQEGLDTIVEAIRQVLRGTIYVSEPVANKLLHELISGDAGHQDSPIKKLSNRELEVFQLIGQGFGTREIAEMLSVSIKTVESYRANIKEKLQLRSGSELIRHAVNWVQGIHPS